MTAGSFINGKLALRSFYFYWNKQSEYFGVFRMEKSRPQGHTFEVGLKVSRQGEQEIGVFLNY